MRKNLFLHKLFILVIFNTVPVALAGNMELNLQCSCGFIPEFGREGLTCSPVLKRFDGENFVSSKTFQYDLGGLNQCELVRTRMRRFDNYLFDLPAEMEKASLYRVNLGMVRPHTETCSYEYSSGIMEWWKCDLELAMIATMPQSRVQAEGATIIVSNPGAESGLADQQPDWSAGLALKRIEVLINEFTKNTPEFSKVDRP